MKLSEAIRLGAMLRPQTFGGLTDGIGTCALGAAEEAVGMQDRWFVVWPNHPTTKASCPVYGCDGPTCGGSIPTQAHLNDDHRWTRERIADWVETIEAQHAPTPEPQPFAEVV